jgi:hypothetical protein
MSKTGSTILSETLNASMNCNFTDFRKKQSFKKTAKGAVFKMFVSSHI